jgi:hypothetical protein
MKIAMNVHGRNGPGGNNIECITRNYRRPDLNDGNFDETYIFVSSDRTAPCWISKRCNVRRMKRQFGGENRNET